MQAISDPSFVMNAGTSPRFFTSMLHPCHNSARVESLLSRPCGPCFERFKKYCSHSASWTEGAVFLGFGFVLAQSQAVAGVPLRQSLAKTQKCSLRMAAVFLKML
jgi:hypothetical protein